MYNNKVYVYKKEDYRDYIDQRESEGIDVLTIAGLDLFDWDENTFDLNLTSAIQAIKSGVYTSLQLEQVLYKVSEINQNIRFIIELDLKNFVIEELGIFFSDIEVICVKKQFTEDCGVVTDNQIKRKVNEINLKDLNILYKEIHNNLIGHNNFKEKLFEEIDVFRFFNTEVRDLPIMSIFLLGPSGVGKTEIARLMHSFLDANPKSSLAKINFANYKNESSLASLIGSPPGYRDSDGDSDLVQKLKRSNTGVLLVDEFEKADSAVHNFFLQLLEEGKFDDAMGKVYDLDGYVIIFTSNLGAEEYVEKIPPELRSRYNMVARFNYLNYEEKLKFALKIIENYGVKINKKMSLKDEERILTGIDLEAENNLRNIQKKIRKNFYMLIKEQD